MALLRYGHVAGPGGGEGALPVCSVLAHDYHCAGAAVSQDQRPCGLMSLDGPLTWVLLRGACWHMVTQPNLTPCTVHTMFSQVSIAPQCRSIAVDGDVSSGWVPGLGSRRPVTTCLLSCELSRWLCTLQFCILGRQSHKTMHSSGRE